MTASRHAPADLLQPKGFDATEVAVEHRLEHLKDLYAMEGVQIGSYSGANNPLNITTERWKIGDSIYGQAQSAGHIGRSPLKKTAQFIAVYKYFTGTNQSWSRDFYKEMKAGDLLITCSVDEIMYKVDGIKAAFVLVPLDLVAPLEPIFRRRVVLPENDIANRLITSSLLLWHDEVSRLNVEDASLFEKTIAAVLLTTLGQRDAEMDTSPMLTRACGHAIRRYISKLDPAQKPSVSFLCETFGASRATIHREFEADGGVAKYMQRRRMNHALWSLQSGEVTHGRVSEVAYEIGFDDPLYFSRAFRRTFGMAPKDVVHLAQS